MENEYSLLAGPNVARTLEQALRDYAEATETGHTANGDPVPDADRARRRDLVRRLAAAS
jgi:hypothetical protein